MKKIRAEEVILDMMKTGAIFASGKKRQEFLTPLLMELYDNDYDRAKAISDLMYEDKKINLIK